MATITHTSPAKVRPVFVLLLASFSALLFLPGAWTLRAEFTISEFHATNSDIDIINPGDDILADEDGIASDWIEIRNPDATARSLAGYHLTDNGNNLTKWTFPDVSIPAGGYLVVFASNKNRAVAGSELHTNFSLAGGGEYLALVHPDGVTVVSGFVPTYPAQFGMISYGIGIGGALTSETLIDYGADVTYFVPSGVLAQDWRLPAFNDSNWATAPTPIGWGYPSFNPPVVVGSSSDISPGMRNINGSAYVRIPFQVDDPAEIVNMTLEMLFEDGFVIYVNGHEVASENKPNPLSWNSNATANTEENNGSDFYDLDFSGHLVAGTNILGVHLLNSTPTSSDLFLLPRLTVEKQDLTLPPQMGYFTDPTPGSTNSVLSAHPPARVDFSIATKAFASGTLQVELSCATPGAVIRYTTNGSLPSNEPATLSPQYTAPIQVSDTTQIRAGAFLPGALPGRVRTEGYFKLAADAAAMTSNLPIVLIDSFGGGEPLPTGSTDRRTMMMVIWEPKGKVNPRSSMLNDPDLVTRSGIRKRGSSTGGELKYSMSVEAWTEKDWEEKSINPFGLGGEDDWILSGRYQWDRSLMRNPFIYQISRDIGRYAARTRFVELFNNRNGGDIRFTGNESTNPEYFGVYSFMDKLDRDNDRIDVDGLDVSITSEPDISGGYIFKNDRGDPGEPTLQVNGFPRALVHIYPDGAVNPRRPNDFFITPAQRDWLRDHLNEIDVAVDAPNGINPATGIHYSDYIDVDSFIDHMWLNALMMNVDWGRLSAWLYKPRNDTLKGGPIWDFDRSAGSEDSRDNNPIGWNPSGDSRVWYDSEYPWYGQVLGFSAEGQDPSNHVSTRPDYYQRAVDRWFELRENQFSQAHIDAVLDSKADAIREAQARNFTRWNGRPPNGGQFAGGLQGWEGEFAQLKNWLNMRYNWIDSQFMTPPAFSTNGGVVPSGFELTLSSSQAPIYYTLDGSDPRAPGGGISPSAIAFDGGPVDDNLISGINDPCKYFIPFDDSIHNTWFQPGFDDSAWNDGVSGLGFETGSPPANLWPALEGGTLIKDEMQFPAESRFAPGGYFRFEFEFDNAANIDTLTLGMKYDDGFVAYLNGVQVASDHVALPTTFNSTANGSTSDSIMAASFVDFDISAFKNAVVNGTNVLAIHGMNSSPSGSDFLIKPKLDVRHIVVANPLILNGSTTVSARAFDGTSWSAPAVHNFVVGADLATANNIVVSQLQYHPADPSPSEITAGFLDSDLFEYAELMNISGNPVDLADVSFVFGVIFNFAGSNVTRLEPGARVLVVSNLAAFRERYGNGLDDIIAGEFLNGTNLANGGEGITLTGAGGAVIKQFAYNDRSPWPESPDGLGPALVLINPLSNPDHSLAASWRASGSPFGSPGSADGVPFTGDPLADDDGDGLNAFAEYAFGTSDSVPGSGNVLSAFIQQDGADEFLRFSYQINLNAIDAVITAEYTSDLLNWSSVPGVIEIKDDVPNGDGTAIVSMETVNPISGTEPFYVRLRVSQAP